jgi:hypothetical protein
MVVRSGHSRKNEVLYSIEQLETAGARVVGVALNGITRSAETVYSRYRYYGNDYLSEGFAPQKGGDGAAKPGFKLPKIFGEKKKPAETVRVASAPGRYMGPLESKPVPENEERKAPPVRTMGARKMPPR